MKDDEKFQFFLAKLFGDLVVSSSEGTTLTAYVWRDHIYFVDMFREVSPTTPKHLNRYPNSPEF